MSIQDYKEEMAGGGGAQVPKFRQWVEQPVSQETGAKSEEDLARVD